MLPDEQKRPPYVKGHEPTIECECGPIEHCPYLRAKLDVAQARVRELEMDSSHLDAAEKQLAGIVDIILAVENRCLAADGPVTPTLQEMTAQELQAIYRLAKRRRPHEHREPS